MLIKDFLSKYENQTQFEKIINSTKLHRLLKSIVKRNNRWSFVCKMILMYNKGLLTPLSIQKTCEKLFGISTIEDLTNLVNACDWNKFDKILFPKIEVKSNKKLNITQLDQLLKNSWIKFHDRSNSHYTDVNYTLIDRDTLDEILEKCPYNRFKYKKEVWDCDEYGLATKAWVSLHVSGALSFGYCAGNFYDPAGKFLFAHAFNIAVLDNESVVLIEPQQDKIIEKQDDIQHWFHKAKDLKISFILF